MRRLQDELVRSDLPKKIVFLVGPRQVGKTWLSKEIGKTSPNTVYLNYDRFEDREIIHKESWLASTQLLILDELHKMPNWKTHLKGIFDTKTDHLQLLVTGSARLDTFRQHGESLAGRFFAHRLMPLSLSEIAGTPWAGDLDRLISRGGFPEPFLADNPVDADRWRLQYIDGLIRTDVLDFEKLHDLRAMQTLFELLRRRVGSPVSNASLARDIGIAPNTVKRYIQILEALFIVFRVVPHSRNVARALQKEPKIYFYDNGLVLGDNGAKFENFVAVSLLKNVLGRTDTEGQRVELKYLRTKDGKEVDFCIVRNDEPQQMIEAKSSQSSVDRSLAGFQRRLQIPAVQLVRQLKREHTDQGVEVRAAHDFLSQLSPF